MRVPMPETETDVRAARITKDDVERHGGTDRCPGWRALKLGKYNTKHTMEDLKRFE